MIALEKKTFYSPLQKIFSTTTRKGWIDPIEDLEKWFDLLNEAFFQSKLENPLLVWNSRLRITAGRFQGGSRFKKKPSVIEIATVLLHEKQASWLVLDTLAHEMIHFWLWTLKKPYGHTALFYQKLKVIGASRYHELPQHRPYRYSYRCPYCFKTYFARKKLSKVACRTCCDQWNQGFYHRRFMLVLEKTLLK